MMKNFLPWIMCGALLAAAVTSQAQNNSSAPARHCATDSMTAEAMKQYPEYAKGRKAFIDYVKSLDTSRGAAKKAAANFTIPVVVHVIHTYGADNISDAQAYDAIRIVNQDYNKLNFDTSDVTIPDFTSIYAKVGIEFKLARIDPNGNPTNGITHTYSPLTNSAGENVKTLVGWDGAKYLNIWVVNNIASGAGGYSYLPCGVPQNREGIVVRNSQFGSIGRANGGNLSVRTMTHEIGHYLGLPHTWGSGNTPGAASNCSIDDNIQDTPNTIGTVGQSCNQLQNTCDVSMPGDLVDNVQNYMDYSNCGKMFTDGQKAVMLGALNMSCRNILYTPNNLIATGTAPGFSNISGPKADFHANNTRVCEGASVTFANHSYNTVMDSTVTYQWSFPGGVPSTSNLRNPVVTYPSAGTYPVTLISTNSVNSSPRTKSDFVSVLSSGSGEMSPFTYSFENTNFPANGSNPAKDWAIESNSTATWQQTSDAAYDGTHSVRISHQNIAKGTVNNLYTANIIKSASAPRLKFKVAYKQRSGANVTSNDQLKIALSPDCGATWFYRYNKSGANLATTTGAVPYMFIPASPSEWREETLELFVGFPASSSVLVKFESTSDNGNALYIDDIRVEATATGVTADIENTAKLDVFPNPSDGTATIRFDLEKPSDVSMEIVNIAGQKIGTKSFSGASAGLHEVKLNEVSNQLPAGIYFVRVSMDGRTFVKKAFVF